MANQDLDALTQAVMLAESRGKRYDKSGNLLTSPKGAQGEMQVMPKTSRNPGFGVKPAADDSPEELARVGKDYLAAMVKKYGDRDTALAAYNWGPGNVNRWLKQGADPAKLPKETQNYIARVARNMGEEPVQVASVAPVVAKESRATDQGSDMLEPVSASGVTSPAYKQALAVSMLGYSADEEDKPEGQTVAEEKLREYEEKLAEATETPARSALADFKLSYRSPFDAFGTPQVKKFADGGEARQDSMLEIPARESVRPMLMTNRTPIRDGEIQSMLAGLGMDEGMLGIDVSKMTRGEKEQLAMTLVGQYNAQIGDAGVHFNVAKPLDAPAGVYPGGVAVSYPVGPGRVSAGYSGVKVPDRSDPIVTGENIGYGMPVSGGDFSVSIGRQRHVPNSTAAQMLYRMKFAEGGVVSSPWSAFDQALAAQKAPVQNVMTVRDVAGTIDGGGGVPSLNTTHASPAQLAAINQGLTAIALGVVPGMMAMDQAFNNGMLSAQAFGHDFSGQQAPADVVDVTGFDPGSLMGSGYEGAGLDAGYADSQTGAESTSSSTSDSEGGVADGVYAKGGDVSRETPSAWEQYWPTGYSTRAAERMFPGQGGQDDQRDVARHMLAAGMMARQYGPKAAEYAGKAHEYTSNPDTFFSAFGIGKPRYDYAVDTRNNQLGVELGLRAKDQADLERLVQDLAKQSTYEDVEGKPRMVSREQLKAWVEANKPQPPQYAEGGDVTDPEALMMENAKDVPAPRMSNEEFFRQVGYGLADVPYVVAGAPVDLTAMAMRPFGYTEKAPVGGSEWIKQKAEAMGIRPPETTDPRLQGPRLAAEIVGSTVNPAGVVRGGVKAAQAAGEGATKAAQAAEKAIDPWVMKTLQEGGLKSELLQSFGPRPAYAVKPRGGVFAPIVEGTPGGDYLSNIKNTFADMPADKAQGYFDFVDKKAQKYFTTSFGTANDPIRAAIASGEIRPFGSDAEKLYMEYLLAAAADPKARGHEQAKRHLEKIYDEATHLFVNAAGPEKEMSASAMMQLSRDTKAKISQQLAVEGVPTEMQNIPHVGISTPASTQKYPHGEASMRKIFEMQNDPATASEMYRRAIAGGEPVWGLATPNMALLSPKDISKAMSVFPPEKLKNMTFEQVIIQGNKKLEPVRFYETAVDKVRSGGKVPKEVWDMFTKPVAKGNGDRQWVQITDPVATDLEGVAMNHSVGGYSREGTGYGVGGKQGFLEGRAQVYSLRDEATGMPKVTVEAEKLPDGNMAVRQVKGRFNSAPEGYMDDVLKLFDKFGDKLEPKNIKREFHSKDAMGNDLNGQNVGVDWPTSYTNWKQFKDGEWAVNPNNGYWTYVQKYAKGGMVERQTADHRKYN